MINWKVRLKNKVWLTAFIAFLVSAVYQFLSMFDIAPAITQDAVMQVASVALQMLSLLGVIIDPTTKGVGDSEQAMTYEKPKE